MINPATLSDKKLYELCQQYGSDIRSLQKKFASLLVEVEKRGLYKIYGFHSIHEFAAKLAGMSPGTVDEIVRVSKKLEDKPLLKNLMEEQGWSKLKVVATVATPETERLWAEKVKEMSKATLETLVREIKKQEEIRPGAEMSTLSFHVTKETETKLRILKQKLEKEKGEVLSWNQVMEELLKRNSEVQEGVEESNLEKMKQTIQETLPKVSKRYIPASVKNYLHQKYHDQCGYPGCKYPSTIVHHTRRFSLIPNHDPDFLVPLCKNHERLAHHGLIEQEEKQPENWQIRFQADHNSEKFLIDQWVVKKRLNK
jgi:hypothetical protein